jgi:DNA-binding MarR family transcriptional regulator
MTSKSRTKLASVITRNDGEVSGLENILGFHIRLAHGAVYRHFSETFNHIDLTQKQVSVLWLIDENAGISQADLGRLLQIDRATMMAIVNRLQARSYLVRSPSPLDGRRQVLTLTSEGQDALTCARRAIAEHEAWLKSRFTETEVATLIKLLRDIHE